MRTLQAFRGKKSVKDKYLKRVEAHYKADEIVQGIYWQNGKGCAVGCTIEGSDHSKYEKELGIPEQIAHLEDIIFEGLSNGKAKGFPVRFLKAIKVGADLSNVIPQLVIWQFEDEKYGLKNIQEVKDDKEVYGFCEEVVALYKRELKGKKPTQKEYQELYEKIYRARAGAWAWAWAMAWAWAGAGAGAWARAWAWAGAGAGVRAKYYEALADKFIKLLEEAPIKKKKK